jgi:hypothetical protein
MMVEIGLSTSNFFPGQFALGAAARAEVECSLPLLDKMGTTGLRLVRHFGVVSETKT